MPYLSNGKVRHIFDSKPVDPAYIQTFPEKLTARVFLSQKYTSISIGGSKKYGTFRYRPNTTLDLGVGATWKFLTLNLSYGIPGLNNGTSEKGKTRYLDLQTHAYLKRFMVDFYGQFYKGYYISNNGKFPNFPEFYKKPDLSVNLLGLSANYIFNSSRFSYRSTLIQNEWQKKSAGTFLVGLEFYYGILNSDNTILPNELLLDFPQRNTQKLRFVNFGPSFGYAYTYVYKEKWFATGSVSFAIASDYTKEFYPSSNQNNFSISSNFSYRGGIGYNSKYWTASLSIVNNNVQAKGASSETAYVIKTGNIRLTYAKRLDLTRKQRKALEIIEKKIP